MLELTEYYDEFIRYYNLASDQQNKCNVSLNSPYGKIPHLESNMNDDLMENVELYDVVERKYAGFSQIINDCFYGWNDSHPYWEKMKSGLYSDQRGRICNLWKDKSNSFSLPEWLYIFILHRVTGSAINYATKPSGYHNTILFFLHKATNIKEMTDIVATHPHTFYTSVGYQFPSFPKIPADKQYRRAGDYFLCEFVPKLARDMADWLESGKRRDLREIGEFMLNWNTEHGLKKYKFQYAAVVADIADWYPQYVNKDSMFYYGTNAVECISYLAARPKKMKTEDFLDVVMTKIYEDTGSFPYNAEDVCCDFIRWVENYVRPGPTYNHLNYDEVWSSCKIKDHPFGRQRAMIDLGLIKTFNNMKSHPSDDTVIKAAAVSVENYKQKVHQFYGSN